MTLMQNLRAHGLVHVPYPAELRQAVCRAARSWQQFCDLPHEVKERFAYAGESNLGGSGYEFKNRPGATLDHKENFDMTLKAMPAFEETMGRIQNGAPLSFVDDAHSTIETMTPFVTELAEEVGRAFGLTGLSDEVVAGRPNWFLRYLHYFNGRETGAEIASPHVDKAGLTLHLHESAPGLEYLAFPDPSAREQRWCAMPVAADETVVIAGMQMQYRSDGRLKALCHRVTANAGTAAIGRSSMVCFIPLLQTPAFNKLALKRLQEYPPGFNYHLPNAGFRKLFA